MTRHNHELLGKTFLYEQPSGTTERLTVTSVSGDDRESTVNMRGSRYRLWQWRAWEVRSMIWQGTLREV